MELKMQALTPFGAELTGVNPAELRDDDRAKLRALLHEHRLLVFRGRELSVDDQISLLRSFGTPLDEKGKGSLSYNVTNTVSDVDFPVLGNTVEQSARGIQYPFHADYEWTRYPHPCISLYAVQCDGDSSPTLFADLVGGLRRLSEQQRQTIEGLSAVHVYDFTPEYNDDRRIRLADVEGDAPLSMYPRTTWPMVVDHPVTGEPMLFVSELMASHVEGMDDAESEGLLQDLFKTLYADDNVYEHHWSTGDLVVWDNLACQHARRDTPATSRRTLRRVAIGSRPTMAEVVGSATGDRAEVLRGSP